MLVDAAVALWIFFTIAFVGLPLPTLVSTAGAYWFKDPAEVMERLKDPPPFSGANASSRFYKGPKSPEEAKRNMEAALLNHGGKWAACLAISGAWLLAIGRRREK